MGFDIKNFWNRSLRSSNPDMRNIMMLILIDLQFRPITNVLFNEIFSFSSYKTVRVYNFKFYQNFVTFGYT